MSNNNNRNPKVTKELNFAYLFHSNSTGLSLMPELQD